MSLEETLSSITKRKLSLTLSLYSFQLKFVRKVSKFLRSKERPVLFITVSNYCYLFLSHTSSRWAFTSSVNVFFKSVSATNYTRNNDLITLCFHRFRQSYFFFRNIFRCLFNSIQDEPFRGCSRMGGLKSHPPPPFLFKICHTYPTMMKLGTVIPYLKKIHTPWVMLRLAFFHRESASFVTSKNTDIECILMHNF